MSDVTVLLNGVDYDFTSITLQILGTRIMKFSSIDFSSPLETGEVRGTHPGVLGTTRGQISHEASITASINEVRKIKRLVAAVNPARGYMVNTFGMRLTIFETVGEPHIINFLGCRLVGSEASWSQGPDHLEQTIPIKPINIIENGLSAVHTNLGIPA